MSHHTLWFGVHWLLSIADREKDSLFPTSRTATFIQPSCQMLLAHSESCTVGSTFSNSFSFLQTEWWIITFTPLLFALALWLMVALWQQIRGILKMFKFKRIWSGQRGRTSVATKSLAFVLLLCTKLEKLMEHFIFALQVQFRGLLQMILVLGIGGSFPYGFHISVINYPSVVSCHLSEAETIKVRAWAPCSP